VSDTAATPCLFCGENTTDFAEHLGPCTRRMRRVVCMTCDEEAGPVIRSDPKITLAWTFTHQSRGHSVGVEWLQ
jgi:hypothetical protein